MKRAKPDRTAVIVTPCGCLYASCIGNWYPPLPDPDAGRAVLADMYEPRWSGGSWKVFVVYASKQSAERALARLKKRCRFFTCRHNRWGTEAAVAC